MLWQDHKSFLEHYKLHVYIILNGLAQWEGAFIQMLHQDNRADRQVMDSFTAT